MYKGLSVSMVIPAYNEEKLIEDTLLAVPPFIDRIYVVDDGSTDATSDIVKEFMHRDNRVELVQHENNRGPGAAIVTGYKKAVGDGYDAAAVIGGDNQMGMEYLSDFLEPFVDDEADYVKGNRFLKGKPKNMPFNRLFGNTCLSIMTKIASGYGYIFDTQDGYTAISRKAIEKVDWSNAWEGYGYVSDFLIRFNVYGLRVKDIYRREVYLPGVKQSQIEIKRYIFVVGPMIVRGFFWRIKEKYFKRRKNKNDFIE